MARRRKPRRYSDEDRANALAALAANGGNVKLTAEQLGIPQQTVRNWASGQCHPAVTNLGEQKKGDLADHLERVAWQLAEAIPGKIAQTPLLQLATSLGIVIDKTQLLRNKPTSINRDEGGDDELRNLTDEELDRRTEEARRRAGEAGDTGSGGCPSGSGTASGGAVPPAGGSGAAQAG